MPSLFSAGSASLRDYLVSPPAWRACVLCKITLVTFKFQRRLPEIYNTTDLLYAILRFLNTTP